MSNETFKETSESIRSNRPRSKRRWGLKILIVLAIVAAVGFWYYHKTVTQPIDVEHATPSQAIGWLAVRDLSEESKETKKKLFKYYFDILKTPSPTEATTEANSDADAGSSAAPARSSETPLRLPKSLESASGLFFIGADKKADAWAKNHVRAPYLRLDYLIRPSAPHDKTTRVLSSDVKPGPSLQRRYQDLRGEAPTRREKKSRIEKNVNLLVMQWFALKAEEYDEIADADADAFLRQAAIDMEGLQEFYNSLRETAKQNELTRVQLLGEFERQTEGWCEIGQLDEIAKALWFKDLLICYVISREANAPNLASPPQLSTKALERLGALKGEEGTTAGEDTTSEAAVDQATEENAGFTIENFKNSVKKRVSGLLENAPFAPSANESPNDSPIDAER